MTVLLISVQFLFLLLLIFYVMSFVAHLLVGSFASVDDDVVGQQRLTIPNFEQFDLTRLLDRLYSKSAFTDIFGFFLVFQM